MKKEVNLNNDMDDAFTKSVDSMEMEPSAKVWKGIDTQLTRSENESLKKRIVFWKRTSVLLSSIIAAAGIFFFYHFNRQDISKDKMAADLNMNNSEPVHAKQETVSRLISQNSVPKQEQEVETPSVQKETPVIAGPKQNEVSGNISEQDEIVKESSVNEQKNVVASKQSQPSLASAVSADKRNDKQNDIAVAKQESQAENKNLIPTESKQNVIEIKKDSVSAIKDSDLVKEKSLPTPLKKDIITSVLKKDSVVETSVQNNFAPVNPDKNHRIYIEGIFSPDFTTRFLKDNNPSDNCTSDFVKCHEAERFSYSQGIKIGYDLGKWSIQTGCIYATQSLCIKPMTMCPYMSNGQMQCSLITSSGTVNIPYSGSQSWGDSMTVKGDSHQTLGFISIPVQVKYKFGTGRLSFYFLAGVSANILVKQQTNLEIGYEYADDDYKTLKTIKGPKNVYYGYTLGAGASYRLSKKWYLNFEPTVSGAMSSINNNAPVNTYPYILALGLMLGYHF